MQVDVQYRLTDNGWLTYKAELINVARMDGKWVAIVYDTEDARVREVEATSIEQWEGSTGEA